MHICFMLLLAFGNFVVLGIIVAIMNQRNSQVMGTLLLAAAAALCDLTGYMAELMAQTKEAALMAVKMSYLGKCFLAWLLLYFIMKYYKCKFSSGLMYTLAAMHAAVYCLVMTCEKHNFYYDTIDFTTEGAYPHLVLSYGVAAYVQIGASVVYAFCIIFLSLRQYMRNRNSIMGNVALLAAVSATIPVCSGILQILGVFKPYNLMDMSLVFSAAVFSMIVLRYRIFETAEVARDGIVDNMTDAVVVLDTDWRVLYTNREADKLFPFISEIQDGNAIKLMKRFCKKGHDIYKIGENHYDVEVEAVWNKKKLVGQIVTMRDITEHIAYSKRMEMLIDEKTKQFGDVQKKVIISFANMIERRDDSTGKHVKRTSEYVRLIAEGLRKNGVYGITDDFIEKISNAAPLHDVGKIAVPDMILNKPGRLTTEEFEEIKKHPLVGKEMLEAVIHDVGDADYLHFAYDMVLSHHEKWDGSGYPYGKAGEEIPLCARIMAVADVFDALTSKRCYKEAYSYEEAFLIIKESAGTHFDPVLVDVFMEMQEDIKKAG